MLRDQRQPKEQAIPAIDRFFRGEQLSAARMNTVGGSINSLIQKVQRPTQKRRPTSTAGVVTPMVILSPTLVDPNITDGIWRTQPIKCSRWTDGANPGEGTPEGEVFDVYVRTINRPDYEATELALFHTLDINGNPEPDESKHSPRYMPVFIENEVMNVNFVPIASRWYFVREAIGIAPVPETNEICAG